MAGGADTGGSRRRRHRRRREIGREPRAGGSSGAGRLEIELQVRDTSTPTGPHPGTPICPEPDQSRRAVLSAALCRPTPLPA
jgi:hypothetical protein